jgi:hypothetical protein
VTKVRDSRWNLQEEEELAGEEATVEEEAKEQVEAEITGRVTRSFLATMPTRLVAKLWATGRKRRGSESEREGSNGNLWAGH